MNAKKILIWVFRLILLTILYYPIWILGTLAIGDLMPTTTSEPGLVSDANGMLILGLINTFLIIGIIVSSRWYGWRLALLCNKQILNRHFSVKLNRHIKVETIGL